MARRRFWTWLAAVLVAKAVGACQPECQDDACPRDFAVPDDCSATNTCTLGGASFTTCAGPWCPGYFTVPQGETLTITLNWGVLGTRNRLLVNALDTSGATDLSKATILFDGQPSSGCTKNPILVECGTIDSSVGSVSLAYPPGDVDISVFLEDGACFDSHPPCAR